jgi:hypothetical protein
MSDGSVGGAGGVGSGGTTLRGARHGSLGEGGAAGAPAMRGAGADMHAVAARPTPRSSDRGRKQSGRDARMPGSRRVVDSDTSTVFTNL